MLNTAKLEQDVRPDEGYIMPRYHRALRAAASMPLYALHVLSGAGKGDEVGEENRAKKGICVGKS